MTGQSQDETACPHVETLTLNEEHANHVADKPNTEDQSSGGAAVGTLPDGETVPANLKGGYKFTNPRPPFKEYPGFYFEEGLLIDNAQIKITAADIAEVTTLTRKNAGNDEVMTEKDVIQEYVNNPENAHVDYAAIICAETKKFLGYIEAEVNTRTGQCYAIIIVNPFIRDDTVTIFRAGLYEAMAAIKSHIEDIAEGKPVTITCGTSSKLTQYQDVLKENGFAFTRSWLNMKLELNEVDIEAPSLPTGLELRPYSKKDQARALYEAQQEAFRDHSGHAEDQPYDRWLFWNDRPSLKEEHFTIAWDGDDIAGAVFASDESANLQGLAFIDIVFVRKPYRCQGLALCLLQQSFRKLKESGFTTVRLFVDGKSKTNAVSLYERAGMSLNREYVSYRLLVQGNPEDIVD